jgi:hypothetical protein
LNPAPKVHEAKQRSRASKLSGKRTEGRPTCGTARCFRMPLVMSQTNSPSLRELEHHHAFIERHIGPNDAEIAQMLHVIGHDSLEAMTDAIVPGCRSNRPRRSRCRKHHRSRSAGQDPHHRRQEQGVPQLHRPGLLRHAHAERHPAQHPREPGLVHGLHAVPGRDLARPHGSADQLPDHGRRPHRHGHRQRLAAGRSHRRRRGDDAGQAFGQVQEQRVLRRRRRASADARSVRTRAEPIGIELRGRPAAQAPTSRQLRRAVAVPGNTSARCNDYKALADACMRAAASSSSPPTCSR